MAYGIDPRLPKEINDWNSPEHWMRSDMQSALDRGNIEKANAIGNVLKADIAAGVQADKNATDIEVMRLGIEPTSIKARKEVESNPTGQETIDAAQAILQGQQSAAQITPGQLPVGSSGNNYVDLLKGGWSLSGKELLFPGASPKKGPMFRI